MKKHFHIAGLAAFLLVLTPALALAHNDSSAKGIIAKLISARLTRGTVASVSGTTITLTGSSSATYTVDASGAKIVRRFGAAMQVSDIQTGDKLTVTGTASGTLVTAKLIRDESLQSHNGTFVGAVKSVNGTTSFVLTSKNRGDQKINLAASTQFRLGSVVSDPSKLAVGETVTVSGVWDRTNANVMASKITIKVLHLNVTGTLQSGAGTNTLTVLGKNNATYTVDAANAKFYHKWGRKAEAATLQNNDQVMVRGTSVSGSNLITATSVRDLSKTAATTQASIAQ